MPPRLLHYSDVETVYDTPERAGRLAGILARRRTDEIVVGTGDNTGPGALAIASNGRQSLEFFDAVRPDVEVFGNHDFDFGREAARRIAAESPCPWLAANLYDGDERFGAGDGVVPRTCVEANGTIVGLVGVTTPDLPEMCAGARGLRVTDPYEAIRQHASRLREAGAEYVVVCSHVGEERTMAAELSGTVDAVIGGHTHDEVAEVAEGVAISRPPAGGAGVNRIRLGPRPSVRVVETDEAPVHEGLTEALRERVRDAGWAETVATVDDPISLAKPCTSRGESRIGNFVTDAYRWAGDADLGVLAARAIRDGGELSGAVSAFDLVRLVPFADDLVVVSLDGERLRSALEELDHRVHGPTLRDWYFGHVSGARLEWDGDRELRSVSVNGEPIDPDRTYTVATSGYYVETDHIFSTFGTDDVVSRPMPQYRALVRFARERGIAPTIEGRISRPDEAEG